MLHKYHNKQCVLGIHDIMFYIHQLADFDYQNCGTSMKDKHISLL